MILKQIEKAAEKLRLIKDEAELTAVVKQALFGHQAEPVWQDFVLQQARLWIQNLFVELDCLADEALEAKHPRVQDLRSVLDHFTPEQIEAELARFFRSSDLNVREEPSAPEFPSLRVDDLQDYIPEVGRECR